MFLFLSLFTCTVYAQNKTYFAKGVVYNGETGKVLANTVVTFNGDTAVTFADGSYKISFTKRDALVKVFAPGFKQKNITWLRLLQHETNELDVVLVPLKKYNVDTTEATTYIKVGNDPLLNTFHTSNTIADRLHGKKISPGTDRDASLLLKRLDGVLVFNQLTQLHTQSLIVNGMGERYNQFLLNGLPVGSADPVTKSFPFSILPSESIAEVSVQNIPDASTPANFAGGTVSVKTKHIADKNFFYILAGAGTFNNLQQTNYLGDQRTALQWLGFADKNSLLSSGMPDTRSRRTMDEYNLQERVAFSSKFNNRIAPVAQKLSIPANRFVLGFGKNILLKNKQQLGIIFYAHQNKTERIDAVDVQAAPDVANNPYPFILTNTLPLLGAVSNDTVHRFASFLSAQLAVTYQTKQSRVTWRTIFSNELNNQFNQRSGLLKPDEDTLSRFGIHYLTQQRTTLNTQLEGDQLLSKKSNFQLQWRANYEYIHFTEPDERSLLLTQNPLDKNTFKLATQSAGSRASDFMNFTNSGRSWRNTTDHNFNAAIDLSLPFKLFGFEQQLKGGLFLQTNYRLLYSDLFLLVNNGGTNETFVTLDQLLMPNRFYPDGLITENFHRKNINGRRQAAVNATLPNLGNYTASLNTGAVYVQLVNRPLKNLAVHWGVRLESANQVVSNIQYEYTETLRSSNAVPLNLNSRTNNTQLLPNVKIVYSPLGSFNFYAGYAKTILRPQLRELANYTSHNPDLFLIQGGNRILETATVEHFNAGVQTSFAANTSFSVNAFYRLIQRPFENVAGTYSKGYFSVTPFNMPPAYMSGIQAAVKLNLYSLIKAPFLTHVSAFANGNITKSVVVAGPVKASTPAYKHSLSGVPPYTFSTGLIIHHPLYPNLTVLFQEAGDMIVAVGSGERVVLTNGNSISAAPELRQTKQRQLDIQVSQKFLKSSLQLIAGVNNLLRTPAVLYQDLNGNKQFDEPLQLTVRNNGAYYKSGTDNTLQNLQTQRHFYITLSFTFK